jgi:S-adenosylmethionine:tRNA ribosyltransferase-isomerase
MTAVFELPFELEAHEPAEARGLRRDQVRMLVGNRITGEVSHHRFADLPSVLHAGDVLVVNTSATIPAAIDVIGADLTLHVSTELPSTGLPSTELPSVPDSREWVVELRQGLRPFAQGAPGPLALSGGAVVRLLRPYTRGRLWVATFSVDDVPGYLMQYGRPIRYSYVDRDWPLATYSSVFGTEPGSAEMPSASRPFTTALVTQLVNAGIAFAPITLHTGVASPESHEKPYPERFRVSADTARLVNSARGAGRRIIAVGTTAVRALESAASADGDVSAADGWTSLVVTPASGVRVTDGLITGFHEPRASHLDMLEAIAGSSLLDTCYSAALRDGYLWHEFGDINLLLRR